MKKKIIGIASVLVSFAIVAFGAFNMSGDKLTAVTEEYNQEMNYGYEEQANPVTIKVIDVVDDGTDNYSGMKVLDTKTITGMRDSTTVIRSKDLFGGNYQPSYIYYTSNGAGSGKFGEGVECTSINFVNYPRVGSSILPPDWNTSARMIGNKAYVSTYERDVTVYFVYSKQGYSVQYVPVIYEPGKSSDRLASGGGTTAGGGSATTKSDITLEMAKPNSGYKIKYYDLWVDGKSVQTFPDSSSTKFIVHKDSISSVENETGSSRIIKINGDAKLYAVFEKENVEDGIWVEFEALPEAIETKITNSSGIVAQAKGAKTSYFVKKGDTASYNFGVNWNYYSVATNGYVSIDGGNLVPSGNVNKAGVNAGHGYVSFDWSKFTSSNPMPKKVTYVFYAYEYKKDKDDKNYKDSEYPYQAIVTSIPEEGGTASANPSMNKVPYTANIVATPAKGYVFDHWTINGEDKGLDKENIQVQINGLDMITAYFEPGEYEVRVASCEPLGGGEATAGLGYYNYGDIPRITIKANDNYELESWSYVSLDGVQHSGKFNEGEKEQIITLPAIKEDIDLHLNFRSLKFKVQSYPAPDSGSSKSYISTTSTVGTENEVEVARGSSVYLKAKAASGYTFQYWTNNKGDIIKGTKASDGSYTANITVMAADSFVAHFAGSKLEYLLETNTADDQIGTVQIEGRQEGIGDMISVDRGDDTPKSIDFTATAKDSNYVFTKWIIIAPDGSQSELASQNITVTYNNTTPELDGRYTYRAVFEKKKVEISATPSIIGKGTLTLESGSTKSTSGKITVDAGSSVKITYTADAENKYWVTEWLKDGSLKITDFDIDSSSVPYKFILTVIADSNAAYTAQITNINPVLYVSVTPSEYGKVSVNDGYASSFITYETDPATSITMVATPTDTNLYRFVEWRKDGAVVGTNETLIIDPLKDDATYEAVFGLKTLKMSVRDNSTGSNTYGFFEIKDYNPSNPEAPDSRTGTRINDMTITAGHKVTFSVTANDPRYEFDHWEKGNNSEFITSQPSFEIENYNEASDMTFIAVFKDTLPSSVKIKAGSTAYEQYISVYDADGNPVKIDSTHYATIPVLRGDNLNLKALIDQNAPYVFDKWVLHGAGGNDIELGTNPANISTDKLLFYDNGPDYTTYVELYLKEVKYTVKGQASPVTGGSVKINDSADGPSRVEVKKNDLVKLYAIPEKGYVFDHWSDGTATLDGAADPDHPEMNVLTIPAVTGDTNITAYFVKENVKVTYKASPTSGGTVSANFYGVKPVSDYVPLNTRVTLSATPEDGYTFVRWEWKDWKTGQQVSSESDVIDFYDISNDVEFTAIFRESTHTVIFTIDDLTGFVNISSAITSITGEKSGDIISTATGGTQISVKIKDGVKLKVKYKTLSDQGIDYIKDNNGNRYTEFTRLSDTEYEFTTPILTEDNQFTAVTSKNTGTLYIKASPAEAGLIKFGSGEFLSSASYKISKGTDVTVEAKVTDPQYRFKYFEYIYPGRNNDSLHEKPTHYSASGNPFTLYNAGDAWVKDVETKLEIIAVFEKVSSKIKVVSDPQTGGKAYINDGLSETDVAAGESFTLTAVPSEGYKFDHFTDENGTVYDYNLASDLKSGFLKIDSVTEDTTYTAHFVKESLNISVYVNPSDGGTFVFKDDTVTEPEDTAGGYVVDYGENFTLTAYPKPGYKFERWDIEDKEGNRNSVTYNPFNVTSIETDTTYTAVFTSVKNTVKTAASPIDGGTVTFGDGLTEKEIGSSETVTIIATPAEGYTFDCLKDSKGVKYDGIENSETGVFTFTIPGITGDEVFTGYFIKKELSVTVSCVPSDAGLLEIGGKAVNSGHTETINGSGSVVVSVTPKDPANYKFIRWEDDEGNVYGTNPLTLANLKKSIKLTAILQKEESKIGFKVIASPAIGGHTTKIINGIDSATIKAKANVGYKFVCWKKGKELISKKSQTDVTDLSDGTVYTAYFEKDENYDAGSGIADEHYYKDPRKQTTPNYSVTEQTIKMQASAQVQADKNSPSNKLPAEKTYAAYDKVTEYFEKHKKNNNYVFDNGELFTTKNELMPIEMIPTETDVLARAEEFSYKKYGDLYKTEILAAVDVSIPSDFAEGPRTYIWKNVDAQFKDNMYVLYLTKADDDYKWATAVYDVFDDVEEQIEGLRFSVPGNGRVVRIVAVRVTIPED